MKLFNGMSDLKYENKFITSNFNKLRFYIPKFTNFVNFRLIKKSKRNAYFRKNPEAYDFMHFPN